MEKYMNYGGDSNIDMFEIGSDQIIVVFKSGKERNYLYNYSIPGKYHVEKMKELAEAGQGLNSYINNEIRTKYADKW